MRKPIMLTALLSAALLIVGCFQTKLSLGSADDAKVDVQYCGKWHFTWKADSGEMESADLVVVNFDGKRYYVEWKQEDEIIRFNGFLVPIGTAMFAQLTPVGDREPSDVHVIARVQLEGLKLTVRHLNETFFKDVTTDAALRQKIEQNLDNNDMYALSLSGALISQP